MRTLAACGTLLLATIALSLCIGARNVPLGEVIAALSLQDLTADQQTILSLRLPRTLLGILAGVAFALSGALMQALTRNPLADPGILGLNAGAAFTMVVAMGVFGITQTSSLIWFSFAGTIGAALAVFAAAGASGGLRGGLTPLRLTLAGVAIGSVLRGLTAALIFLDPKSFETMLNWEAGSLAVTGSTALAVAGPFVAVGAGLALLMAPILNIIGLGDTAAQSLGARILTVRLLTVLAVTLLTGAATAAAGPLAFLGLVAPFVARALVGHDQRWIFAHTLLLGPILLLGADLIGRLTMRPAEIQVGIVLACIGAPVLIWLVRGGKVAEL